ncbi:MAG: arylsulfatase [Proteobacteria bacterium]|nr:arylsulfatase [Pseudomonadota bacterium]
MSKLSRREFVRTLCASALFLGAAGKATAKGGSRKPNIVYILVDDMGWGDIKAYNAHSAIPTPNLDKLAAQGMRFTDMHAPSAVCTPSRYGILTGRYCWRSRLKSGVLYGYDPSLIEDGRLTVAGMLAKAGYYTAGVGKWHLGLGAGEKTDYSKPLTPAPTDHGFQYYFGIPASLDMAPYLYFENDRAVSLPTTETKGENERRGVFWRAGAMAPDFKLEQVVPTLTQKAVDIIHSRAKTQAQPFFLYFSLPSPHTPWLPLPEYRGKSHAGDYGDYVCETDAMVGRILDALGEAGLAEDTLVVFTSDNGADWKESDIDSYAHRANAGWRGRKADAWEAGHRVPFIVRWPGHVRAGAVSAELGSLADFMATTAAVLNIPLPDDAAEDSYNLLPALEQTNRHPIRATIVDHSLEGMFTIREGNWQLILGLGSGGFTEPVRVEQKPGGPAGQLYDLASDPGQVYNLYDARPDIVKRLSALLEEYKRAGRTRPRSG